MSPKSTPAEVLGRARPAHDVAPRDFGAPRRMGSARLLELGVALEDALPALERKLQELTGLPASLTAGEPSEGDADALIGALREPLCVLRFQSAGAPAWLAWESAAAVGLVEAQLGSPGKPAARRLSTIEVRLAAALLGEVARVVGTVAGVATASFALVQSAAELGSWREAGPGADAHRLVVPLKLVLGAEKSKLRVILAGVAWEAPASAPTLPAKLPAHLEHVEVELSAELAGCELTLDELLALEPGDVIPVAARPGDPIPLRVEGLALARARIGRHAGRLAVRVERIELHPEAAA
ncbi:MAG TPA: FliM/FliN family flagellar motor switch protein [Planctomycetota bacterium]